MTCKTILGTALIMAATLPMTANASQPSDTESETGIFKFDATTRVDWQIDRMDDKTDDSQTGFKGKYLMFRIDGEIANGLTYSWRQRLNKSNENQSLFESTDWLYANYYTNGWNFQAGKEVVAIGGWEYDRFPADLYGCSVFWMNIPCFQLGASVGYDVTAADRLTVQATQSPFHANATSNSYSYNLMWTGTHGLFQSLWSVNLLEYTPGHYINYISLGNRFTMDKFTLELDLMNRAASHQAFWAKDCSVVAELAYKPAAAWRIHAKATYDVNHSGTDADLTVANGTELTMMGGGLEYYPIRGNRNSLRLHAAAYYAWGKNSNTADLMQNKTLFANVGVTWNMNILNIKKKH